MSRSSSRSSSCDRFEIKKVVGPKQKFRPISDAGVEDEEEKPKKRRNEEFLIENVNLLGK